MKTPAKWVRTFDILLLESIREALNIILDEKAAESFLFHLEGKNLLRRDEIMKNQEAIGDELRKVFGLGSTKIENLIAALLFSKVGLKFEKRDHSLNEFVQYAKLHGQVAVSPLGHTTRLDTVDLKIIDALRRDARKPVLQISKEIGVSRPTVISKLSRLIGGKILSLKPALNLSELNMKTSLVAFEAKNSEARQKLEKTILSCPRALMLLKPTDKANMLALLWGEDQNTLNSTVESFRSIRDTELVSVHSSDPPLLTDAFSLRVFPVKSEIAPCGRKCADCYRFIEGQCMGCPAVDVYKGFL